MSRLPARRARLRSARPPGEEFFCVNCRAPLQNAFPREAGDCCPLCRLGLRGLDAAYCFGDYDGALRELIDLFKYGKAQSLAGPRHIPPADCGFNQAEVLARWRSRRAGTPVLRAPRRARAAGTQAGLSDSRRGDAAQAFRARRRAPIEGKRILPVDDVMTNGSTGAGCATALKRAGAAKVATLTRAAVDRRMDGRQARAAAPATGDV